MTDKSKKTELETEHEQLKMKAASAFGQALQFLDDLPDSPPKKPIPFPYGSPKPRPYGWYFG